MADLYSTNLYKIDGYEVLNVEYVLKETRILKVKKTENQIHYAIKVLLDTKRKDMVQKEINILQAISSPYVVKCYGIIDVGYSNNNFTGIIMDFCSHFNVRYLIDFCKEKKTMIPMSTIAYIMYCVVHGLFDLNLMGVVHRDVKPENMFVTEANEIKLGDFGISTNLPDGRTVQCNDGAGTFNYMAPELFSDNVLISSKTDVWGVGCVLYELCTLDSFFHSPMEIIPYENILKKERIDELNSDVKEVIGMCLTKQFDKRKSIQELLIYLNESFFPRYLPPLQDLILPPNFAIENLDKIDRNDMSSPMTRQLVQNAPAIRARASSVQNPKSELNSAKEKEYQDRINELQDKLLVMRKTKYHDNGMRKDVEFVTEDNLMSSKMIDENKQLKQQLLNAREQIETYRKSFDGFQKTGNIGDINTELTQSRIAQQKLSQSISQLENEKQLLLQQNCQMSKLLTEKDVLINNMNSQLNKSRTSMITNPDKIPPAPSAQYCIVKSNIYPGGSLVFPPNVPKLPFNLVYRSTVNGSSKSIFHSICDVKKRTSTLYILHTRENEFITIFTGQGNIKMPQQKKYPILDSEVLIMMIKNKTWYTFEPCNPARAYFYDPEFGPIFGAPNDPCLKLDMTTAKIELAVKTEPIYNIPWKNLATLTGSFFRSHLYTYIVDMEVFFEERL